MIRLSALWLRVGQQGSTPIWTARAQRRISESLKFRRAQSDDGYMNGSAVGENEQLRKNLPVGSVNEVIDKMLERDQHPAAKHIALQTQLGDFDRRHSQADRAVGRQDHYGHPQGSYGSTTAIA